MWATFPQIADALRVMEAWGFEYTPDFVLTYADGTVEVVEVKSKFTRRQQRDYIHRRRMFIDLVAEPRGWRFVEHITPDTAAEIKAWKKCAQQTERKG